MSTDPAMCIATVYRCVKLLSESVAQLPVKYLVRRGGVFKESEGDRLQMLLTIEPAPDTNAFDFWAQAIQNILLDGNAYIVQVSDYGTDITRMVLCGRNTVSYDETTGIYTVSDYEHGLYGSYSEREVIHLKGLSVGRGHRGESVLGYARATLETARAGREEIYKRITSGGKVHGIITNARSVGGYGELQDAELAKAAKSIDIQLQEQNIVGLPGPADFRQVSLSSADLQLIESQRLTVREICRFFGVHPSFVFDDTSNNYKSAEMANAAFLSNTLNPILCKIENELRRKLIPEHLWSERKFEFDRSSLLTCNLESKASYYGKMLAAGVFSPNDIRRKENMAPVADGDRVFVSANLRGVDEPAGNVAAASDKEPKEIDKDEQEQD